VKLAAVRSEPLSRSALISLCADAPAFRAESRRLLRRTALSARFVIPGGFDPFAETAQTIICDSESHL
jgi:hypothetical protein